MELILKGRNRALILTVAFVLHVFLSSHAYGVAYCALRDPISTIEQFFPNFTSYRTNQRSLSKSDKVQMSESLPELHQAETGFHTLYSVYDDDGILGHVVAGQSKGRFGLNIIAWKLAPSGEILDVTYIRNRNGKFSAEKHANVVQLVVRTDQFELLQMLQQYEKGASDIETISMIRSSWRTTALVNRLWRDLLTEPLDAR